MSSQPAAAMTPTPPDEEGTPVSVKIRERINAIQADTANSIQEITQIAGVIGEINDLQATIAALGEDTVDLEIAPGVVTR